MEVLGSAASAFAVISVADQLAHRIKQLYEFWSAVSDAPGNISALSAGLQPLLGILTQISKDGQKYGEDKSTTDILAQCLSQVTALFGITESLEKGFASSSKRQRKWSAIKAVFNEDKINSFRSELADLKSTLTLAQVRMLSRSSNAHFEEQKRSALLLQASLAKLTTPERPKLAQISGEEINACISAFYLSDIASKLDTIPKREPGTCEWVTKHRNYRAWVDSPSSELLWLSGNPGCGKTVISSFIIQSLSNQPGRLTIYFMCDDKLENFRNKEDIMRSILHQLLKLDSSLVRHAIEYFRSMGSSVAKSSATMWAIFIDILKDSDRSKPIYFILDALDECQQESREWILEKLGQLFGLDPVSQTTSQTVSTFKLLVTSRPWEDIEFEFRNLTRIRLKTEIEGGIQEDINVFIHSQVRALAKRCRHSPTQQELITNALQSKSNGMFLWVSLIVKDLTRTPARDIEKRLQQLPKTLFQVYDSILSKIDDSSVDRVKLILMWVTTAYRPMNLEELALACERGLDCANPSNLEDLVNDLIWDIGLCGPMLAVRYRSVHLTHQSAKDYLLSEGPEKSESKHFHSQIAESQASAHKCCLSYLALKDFDIDIRTNRHGWEGFDLAIGPHLDKFPFLSYCSQYWLVHFDECVGQQSSVDQAVAFFMQHTLLMTWFLAYSFLINIDLHLRAYIGSPLHMAVLIGRAPIVEGLLGVPAVDLEAKDSESCAVLMRSVDWPLGSDPSSEDKRAEILQMLVSQGANLATSSEGQTPLHLAAESGQQRLTDILLKAGAAVDAQDSAGRTALHKTTVRYDLKVAQNLIHHGATIDIQDEDEDTPLSLCISGIFDTGDQEMICPMITLFLEAGADINKRIRGKSLLECVSRDDQVLEHLLRHGAKLHLRPEQSDETSYLHSAVLTKSFHLIPLLLEAGADMDTMRSSISGRKVSPLELAISDGQVDTVKLFTAHRERSGKTIQPQNLKLVQLHRAVLLCDNFLAEDILANGTICNFSTEDSHGMTILSQAVQGGNLTLVKTISREMRNASVREFPHDLNSIKALWLAASLGHAETVKLLLDMEIPLQGNKSLWLSARIQTEWTNRKEHQVDDTWNPLFAAAFDGHESVAKILLARGANPEASSRSNGKFEEKVIKVACKQGQANFVRLLIQHKTRVEPTLIWDVCYGGHESLVSILLEEGGCNINAKCYSGGSSALLMGSSERFTIAVDVKRIIQELLRQGADIQTTNDRGCNCLHQVIANSSLEDVVTLLIEHGIDLEAKNENGQTPLLYSVAYRIRELNLAILRILLKSGANTCAVDLKGRTPLHIVAEELVENAMKDATEIFELLFSHGADVRHKDNAGETALMIATRLKKRVIMAILIEWEEEHPFE